MFVKFPQNRGTNAARNEAVKVSLFEDYILLGEYGKAKGLNISDFCGKKEKILGMVCRLHTGWCYGLLLLSYLLLKYKLLKKKLKV